MDNETKQSETVDDLVACPRFRWMPGMRYWLKSWDPTDMLRVSERPEQIASLNRPDSGARPDLDDPATAGQMVPLVQEAWGPESELVVTIRAEGSAAVDVWTEGCETFTGTTLGRALAAALLAAPTNGGGR